MPEISLMTMSMFFRALYMYRLDGDLETLEDRYEEIMELGHDSGYKAVDVTAIEVNSLSLATVKKYLNKYNLKVSSYIHFDKFMATEKNSTEESITTGKTAVDIAKELDTNILMLVPQSEAKSDDYSPKEIRSQLVQHWTPIVAYAKGKGIQVAVEDTPDLKLHFCKSDNVREVLEQIPDLGIVYDSGNMLLVGENPIEYYSKFKNSVVHIHLKDMRYTKVNEQFTDTAEDGRKMKAAPIGTGFLNLKALMERINESQYGGYLSIEFAVDPEKGFYKSLVDSREYVLNLMK